MQPTKRQRVETFFDFYLYLVLGLDCSGLILDALVINAPCLFIKTLIRLNTSHLLFWSDFHTGIIRSYRMGRHVIKILPCAADIRVCIIILYYFNHNLSCPCFELVEAWPDYLRRRIETEGYQYLHTCISTHHELP